jgi:putative PIN family toxin of toxin-antitoxin system
VRVVCDTNVLVAGLVADGLCRDIVKRRLLLVDLFTSAALLEELDLTLRSKFRIDAAELPLLRAYRERAGVVTPAKLTRAVCRNPDDDVVLETAKAASADCILTGDQDLLGLERFEDIAIVSPRAFVEMMDRG